MLGASFIMIIIVILVIVVIIYLVNNFNQYHSPDNWKQRANDRKYWEDRKKRT